MEHELLFNWIENNTTPRSSINYKYDTSNIRLAFEKDTGIYVTNDDVNTVMLQLGYHAASFANDPYLNFNVSSQSRALIIYQNDVLGSH